MCHVKIFILGKKRGAVPIYLKFSRGALRIAGTVNQGAKLLHTTSRTFFQRSPRRIGPLALWTSELSTFPCYQWWRIFAEAPLGPRSMWISELSFYMLPVMKTFIKYFGQQTFKSHQFLLWWAHQPSLITLPPGVQPQPIETRNSRFSRKRNVFFIRYLILKAQNIFSHISKSIVNISTSTSLYGLVIADVGGLTEISTVMTLWVSFS